jgi:hypothetical protein
VSAYNTSPILPILGRYVYPSSIVFSDLKRKEKNADTWAIRVSQEYRLFLFFFKKYARMALGTLSTRLRHGKPSLSSLLTLIISALSIYSVDWPSQRIRSDWAHRGSCCRSCLLLGVRACLLAARLSCVVLLAAGARRCSHWCILQAWMGQYNDWGNWWDDHSDLKQTWRQQMWQIFHSIQLFFV